MSLYFKGDPIAFGMYPCSNSLGTALSFLVGVLSYQALGFKWGMIMNNAVLAFLSFIFAILFWLLTREEMAKKKEEDDRIKAEKEALMPPKKKEKKTFKEKLCGCLKGYFGVMNPTLICLLLIRGTLLNVTPNYVIFAQNLNIKHFMLKTNHISTYMLTSMYVPAIVFAVMISCYIKKQGKRLIFLVIGAILGIICTFMFLYLPVGVRWFIVLVPWLMCGTIYGVTISVYMGCVGLSVDKADVPIAYGMDGTMTGISNLLWSFLIGVITKVPDSKLDERLVYCLWMMLCIVLLSISLLVIVWILQYKKGNYMQLNPMELEKWQTIQDAEKKRKEEEELAQAIEEQRHQEKGDKKQTEGDDDDDIDISVDIETSKDGDDKKDENKN